MIRHTLKMMWTERRLNAWIMLELMLVFVVMWFCVDYLNLMVQRYSQPKGFDVEHTYWLNFGLKNDRKEQFYSLDNRNETDSLQELFANDGMLIYERLAALPYVESVCYSRDSLSHSIRNANAKFVSPSYFDVFKIQVAKRPNYSWDNPLAKKQVIIGGDEKNQFTQQSVDSLKTVTVGKETLQVAGVANGIKFTDFDKYRATAFLPLPAWHTIPSKAHIHIRVKPHADVDFISQFTRQVKDKLNIGPFYFTGIESEKARHDIFIKIAGYADNFKNIFTVIAFIIINVFLGVVGTFWFRVQSRSAEVGLRCAVGSSKGQVRKLILSESLLTLLAASIPATAIALTFTHIGIIGELGVPSVNHALDQLGVLHYVANYAITTCLLAAMVLTGAYFPAKRASTIQPAAVLHAE